MRTLLRAVGATLLLVPGFLIVAPVAAADPDSCALLPAGAGFQVTQSGTDCTAFLSGPDTDITQNISVFISWYPTAYDAHASINVSPGSPPTNYGDIGWEGDNGSSVYAVVFARGQYQVIIGTGAIMSDARILDAKGYAAAIDAAIVAGILATPIPSTDLPTLMPSPSPDVPTPTPSLSPDPAAGTLTTGLACGTDLRVVRCTASPGGALSDAELVYEWTFDGFARPETGSTMELDWVAEAVATGSHTILVTVRDSLHANVGAAVGATSVELGLSVRLICSYEVSDSQYAVLCTATPLNAFSTALLSFQWSYSFIDAGGRQRDGVDSSTDERFSRTFDRGAVTVNVVAHDTSNSQQSSPVSYVLAIDPTATLTEILTGGQTAVPQNAIDALSGSAAVAAVVGGLALLSGVFIGGAGSGAGRGAGAGSGAPGGGVGPAPAASSDPFANAAGLLAAEAGQLPPITPATLQEWKDLSGWPPGPDADETFRKTILMLRWIGATPDVILSQLREQALRIRARL